MSKNLDWDVHRNKVTAKWLKNGKFGIYTHWGVYSVPAYGPRNGTFYPKFMYNKGDDVYKHHVKTYGDPSEFGYKDFIPKFTAEKFDPDQWAKLFKKAGAQFAGPVAEHHDGFSMWDSNYNKWNAANMGPKRDVVGELEKSIRAEDMYFMVSFHHARNWKYYDNRREGYDTSDPRYAGLYAPLHKKGEKPNKEFLDMWLGKIKEVINNYQPDMIWFDGCLRFIQEHYIHEFLSYYYNKAREKDKEVVVTYKHHDLVPGSALLDLELGRFNELTYHDWITDTTVERGGKWSYVRDAQYKTATALIHYLIDNVSKNGYMLLNVGPKANGEIPEIAKNLLINIGKWLEVNREAIYGTSPWTKYGEGPTQMEKGGPFNEDQRLNYTAEDIRFTIKNNVLYAICLNWPNNNEILIKTVTEKLYKSEISSIKMLGSNKKLEWKYSDRGLIIKTPSVKPCEHAYVIRIERKDPF